MRTALRSGWIAGILLLGFVMLPMAMSGASVAVPDIGADLEVDGSTTSWVVTGYFLAASSLMLVIGSLADSLGRRRIYRTGAIVYTLGAALAATAPTVTILLIGRIVSGSGAAAIMAAGAATAAATFEGPARTRMFAGFGTAAAVGLAAGPVASGLLVETLGWRGAFGIFAGAGLVLVLGSTVLPESRRQDPAPIDWIGAGLVVIGLCSLMFAAAGAPSRGWAHPVTVIAVAVTLASLVALLRVERRLTAPIIDPALLRNATFTAWLLALGAVSLGYGGLLAHLPSFLHGVLGFSPSQSGLMLLTPVVPMVLLPLLVGQVSTRVPARLLIGPALMLITAGNAWLGIVIDPDVTAIGLALPLLTIGLGLGTATGFVDAQAMNQVDPDRHGLAAGMVNTVRGASTTLTMALLGSALVALIASGTSDPGEAGRLATGAASSGHLAVVVSDAWTTALLTLAAVCAAITLGVMILLNRRGAPRSLDSDADRRKTPPDGHQSGEKLHT